MYAHGKVWNVRHTLSVVTSCKEPLGNTMMYLAVQPLATIWAEFPSIQFKLPAKRWIPTWNQCVTAPPFKIYFTKYYSRSHYLHKRYISTKQRHLDVTYIFKRNIANLAKCSPYLPSAVTKCFHLGASCWVAPYCWSWTWSLSWSRYLGWW